MRNSKKQSCRFFCILAFKKAQAGGGVFGVDRKHGAADRLFPVVKDQKGQDGEIVAEHMSSCENLPFFFGILRKLPGGVQTPRKFQKFFQI